MPPQLGDFGRLKLEAYREWKSPQRQIQFLFSKDGVPSFETSKKPAWLAQMDFPEDYLWVDTVPDYPAYSQDAQRWWSELRECTLVDRFNWHLVQQSMAKFTCLVELKAKPGADWVEVLPEEQHVTADVRASGSSTRSGSGSGAAKRGRRGQRRSSGLRYEIKD